MQIAPVNINSVPNEAEKRVVAPTFEHGLTHNSKSPYSVKQKAIVAGTTTLGVVAAIAILAKSAKYSLAPSKMFKNIQNSYISKVKFTEKEVVSIGAGSSLGGLAGGYIIDKNSENRKAKRRESLMQIGNVSIPILTVGACARITKKANKIIKTAACVGGIFAGVYLANVLMNVLSNALFKNTNGRDVKATDFSAHLDDMVVAANYISDAKLIHYIARVIPLALMFAGNEVGNKTSDNNC